LLERSHHLVVNTKKMRNNAWKWPNLTIDFVFIMDAKLTPRPVRTVELVLNSSIVPLTSVKLLLVAVARRKQTLHL
jgi:hypothetical protein